MKRTIPLLLLCVAAGAADENRDWFQLKESNNSWAFGVLTNEMNRYSHAEDFACHVDFTAFPVENRTTAAVWIDRYLTNAVPSWATNEARRAAAERILALPTTPLPFVTNHFVRVLASFPPPD